jgi:hypothetical protein
MTFDPTTHSNLLYYLPNVADEPGKFFQGIASDGGAADEAAELVGTITANTGVVFNAASMAPSTEYRIPLASDGYGNLGLQGTAARFLRHASTSAANTIHQNRRVWIIAVFQPNTGITNTRSILDSTNQANSDATSAQGFTMGTAGFANASSIGGIYRKTSGAVGRVRIKNATATPIVDLYSEDDLYELVPSRHVLISYVDPAELCHIRVDNGRKAYGRVVGAAGTGNAAFNFCLLNRASANLEFPGILLAAGVYTDYPGDDALDEWLERWPLGAIAGSSEIRVGEHHLNFSKDQAGMPYCHWFKGQRVSGVNDSTQNEDGYGTVMNDGVATDYLGESAGNTGGPHRNETLTSTTILVDGTSPGAYATGTLYEGNSSVAVTRNTELGISFYLTETTTLTPNALRCHTLLERRNDGRTVNPLYVRTSRNHDYEDFLAFDIDGATLHDSSVTAVDFECDQGTIAIAQWSPETSLMALTVLTQGRDIPNTFLILHSATSRRVYMRLDNISSSTNGQTFEVELYSKYYETTAGAWKALAESELLRILNPPRGGGGIGCRMGIGL